MGVVDRDKRRIRATSSSAAPPSAPRSTHSWATPNAASPVRSLLTGPAGIGKSALVQYAIDVASELPCRPRHRRRVGDGLRLRRRAPAGAAAPRLRRGAPRTPTGRARRRTRQGAARRPRPVPRRPRGPEPRRRGSSRRSRVLVVDRRRAVARRRVGDGAVVRRAPAPRRTRRVARHHARDTRRPRPLRRHPPRSTSAGCPPPRPSSC